MNNLTIYPAAFGEPSASPFCVKAMCMLSLANVEHTVTETADPRKAPQGKLPILETDSGVIADSDDIRDHIEQLTGYDFDEGLSAQERASSRAIIRMIEEHIYFSIVCDRWGRDDNWVHVKATFFADIPFPLNGIATRYIRKQALADLAGQGMGRRSETERFGRIKKDLKAVADLVADTPFLFGDAPKAADISAITMLYALIAPPFDSELSNFVKQDRRLVDYMKRGRNLFYPAEYSLGA